MNTVSSFRICSFNLRGFSKKNPKLQMVKLQLQVSRHNRYAKHSPKPGGSGYDGEEQQENFSRILQPDIDTQPVSRNNGTPEEVMTL